MDRSFRKNGYIFNFKGSTIAKIDSDKNKYYAVIVKCGHCGKGYYIPVIFATYCKDIQTAIALIREVPRVKHSHKTAILNAFEISKLENLLIEAINERDPYLKGYFTKHDHELIDRRIVETWKYKQIINENKNVKKPEYRESLKTSDTYEDSQVLQRYFAPYKSGNNIIFQRRINIREMLDQYFHYAAATAFKRSNFAILSLYYQIYGKNNPIGLIYHDGWMSAIAANGKTYTKALPDKYITKIEESGILEQDKLEQLRNDEVDFVDDYTPNSGYALEKFNRRMQKHNDIIKGKSGTQPGNY